MALSDPNLSLSSGMPSHPFRKAVVRGLGVLFLIISSINNGNDQLCRSSDRR